MANAQATRCSAIFRCSSIHRCSSHETVCGRFAFRSGTPTWYGGQPFLASYQTGLFSPFVVASVLLPPADALLAHAVLRLLIGGVGMFLFLRRLGLAPPAGGLAR